MSTGSSLDLPLWLQPPLPFAACGLSSSHLPADLAWAEYTPFPLPDQFSETGSLLLLLEACVISLQKTLLDAPHPQLEAGAPCPYFQSAPSNPSAAVHTVPFSPARWSLFN